MAYKRIARYTPDVNVTRGVLQNNYFTIPNFATFKGSSSVDSAETTIVNNDKSTYKSSNVPNSNFTITFNNHSFKLSGVSLLSCYSSQCVYSFDIFGSNDGKAWNKECSVDKDVDYFKGAIRYADCASNKKYTNYRLMHRAGTYDNSLELYYLELFGDLFTRTNCVIMHTCKARVYNNILSLTHILLIIS